MLKILLTSAEKAFNIVDLAANYIYTIIQSIY